MRFIIIFMGKFFSFKRELAIMLFFCEGVLSVILTDILCKILKWLCCVFI